jgi:hypothetical protein
MVLVSTLMRDAVSVCFQAGQVADMVRPPPMLAVAPGPPDSMGPQPASSSGAARNGETTVQGRRS